MKGAVDTGCCRRLCVLWEIDVSSVRAAVQIVGLLDHTSHMWLSQLASLGAVSSSHFSKSPKAAVLGRLHSLQGQEAIAS